MSAALILFCCSGTGWFGALNEGLTGNGSILITKAILGCVTGCIFAFFVSAAWTAVIG